MVWAPGNRVATVVVDPDRAIAFLDGAVAEAHAVRNTLIENVALVSIISARARFGDPVAALDVTGRSQRRWPA